MSFNSESCITHRFGHFVYPSSVNTSKDNATTNWVAIWALFLSGCTLAVHVGKFPAALPLLVDEFDLTLVQAGNLVSMYAFLIMLFAVIAGVIIARVGYVSFATTGVAFCMLGSFAGAFADTITGLMLSRAFEGLGWLVGVVALPTLLSTLALPKDRPVVMGLWSAFMPFGSGGMLFLAPVLQSFGGWRLSWVVASVLSLLGVVTVALVCHWQRESLHSLKNVGSTGKLTDMRQRESIAVALCFLCYSFQFVSVTTFLPTLLVQDSGMQLANASYWAALVLLSNAIGNLAAGWLINAGLKQSHILAVTFLFMGFFACIALSVSHTPVRITAAILMSAIGGVIPGTLFSTAAIIASSAASVGIIIGFMIMGLGTGQLSGPMAMTRLIEWTGHWYSGGMMTLVVAVLGAVFARWLYKLPVVTKQTTT